MSTGNEACSSRESGGRAELRGYRYLIKLEAEGAEVDEIGVPKRWKEWIAAWMRGAWFAYPSSSRSVLIISGVTPGVPLADVLFNVGMRRMLVRARRRMSDAGIISHMEVRVHRSSEQRSIQRSSSQLTVPRTWTTRR